MTDIEKRLAEIWCALERAAEVRVRNHDIIKETSDD